MMNQIMLFVLLSSLLHPSYSRATTPNSNTSEIQIFFHPQIHPRGIKYQIEDEHLKMAIVRSQVEILNFLFRHRDQPVVMFSEGQFRRYSARSKFAFSFGRKIKPLEVRRQFANVNFPIDADNLSDEQRRIVFEVGGANVGMLLEFAALSLPGASLSQEVKTAFKVLQKTFVLIKNIRSSEIKAESLDPFAAMNGSHIFEDRERAAVKNVQKFIRAGKLKPGGKVVVVYGGEHRFDFIYGNIKVIRVESESYKWMAEAQLESQRNFEAIMQKCVRDLEGQASSLD